MCVYLQTERGGAIRFLTLKNRLCDLLFACTDSAEFVLRFGAGVHEGLRDDVQRRVHHLRHVDVEDEVRVPQDVHPEPRRQAEETENTFF